MCNMLGGRGTSYSYPMLKDFNFELDNEIITGLQLFGKTSDLPISDRCLDLTLHILCSVSAPPCNADTGLLMLFCERSCRIHQQLKDNHICDEVGACLQELDEITVSQNFKNLAKAYFEFNCSDPATYYFMNVTDSDPYLCTDLFSPEVKGE